MFAQTSCAFVAKKVTLCVQNHKRICVQFICVCGAAKLLVVYSWLGLHTYDPVRRVIIYHVLMAHELVARSGYSTKPQYRHTMPVRDMHSMACFADVLSHHYASGPVDQIPPTIFLKILATKAKRRAEIKLTPSHEMTEEETLARWREADRPDFCKTDAASAVSPPVLAQGSAARSLCRLTHKAATSNTHTQQLSCAIASSETSGLQGDRHSIAYFANAQGTTRLQGPKKKYPPITFPEILAEKMRQLGDTNREDLTDQEKLDFNTNNALGPEFEPVDLTHSGKPEFEPVERNEAWEAIVSPMPKGKLAPEMEHLKLQSSAIAAAR